MFSFIISTVDNSPFLQNCVNSILPVIGADDEAVIVHQGGCFNKVVSKFSSERISVIHAGNMGLSLARNFGANAAKNDVLVFLDDDVVIDSKYINNVKAHLQNHKIACICGRILITGSSEPYAWVHDEKTAIISRSPFKLKKCLGGNMAFRRDVFSEIGGFDELFGINAKYGGAEDRDIVLRILNTGKYLVVYAPDVFCYHPKEDNTNTEAFLKKTYNYGRGEGAVYAKHIYKYGKINIIINFAAEIARPLAGIAGSLLGANPLRVKVLMSSIKGRINGFFEYAKNR